MEISYTKKPIVHGPSLAGYRDVVSGEDIVDIVAGRHLLLHFFTGGCVNCIHMIAELASLPIPESLALIGVHTGKFDREKESEWIGKLIHRYGIDHPVVNDAEGKLWDAFAVRAWPTLILLSADGYEIARVSGEGTAAKMVEAFEEYMGEAEYETMRARAVESGNIVSAFSKVYADRTHLYLSDIGLGAVHVCTHHGRIFKTIEGFAEPQGLFAHDGILYVADRAAGRVVAVDLQNWSTKIVAEGLRSPTGLTGNAEGLQIAVAGSHQIWQIRYDGSGLVPMAGLGSEGLRDGMMRGEAQFAQPTDLDWLDEVLYIIDAEGSALRSIEEGVVHTPIGWDLFTFGDRDGIGETVRLQHPEGLCAGIGGCGNHRIFICDTYNDKIKVYDPLNGRVTTLVESVEAPTGICKSECYLYVTELGKETLFRFDISSMQYERLEIA